MLRFLGLAGWIPLALILGCGGDGDSDGSSPAGPSGAGGHTSSTAGGGGAAGSGGGGGGTTPTGCRAVDDPPVPPPSGASYYIAPDGDDGGEGTEQSPWRSLTAASEKMAPGDVAYLRGGTYSGQVEIRASGEPDAPLHFVAAPGEVPLLTATLPTTSHNDLVRVYGSHLVFDGLVFATNLPSPGANVLINGAYWEPPGASWVTLRNCEIYGAPGQGVIVSGEQNLIDHCDIHDNGENLQFDHGIYVEGACNIVRASTVHHNWAFGIHVYRGETDGVGGQNLVELNYVYTNGYGTLAQAPEELTSGIVLSSHHPNNVVRNNVVCDSARLGIYVLDEQPGNQLLGNVTCYSGLAGVAFGAVGEGNSVHGAVSFNDGQAALVSRTGVVSDDNVFFSTMGAPVLLWNDEVFDLAGFQAASGQDAHSTVADPGFANLPATGFVADDAASYDFCTPLNPALCAMP